MHKVLSNMFRSMCNSYNMYPIDDSTIFNHCLSPCYYHVTLLQKVALFIMKLKYLLPYQISAYRTQILLICYTFRPLHKMDDTQHSRSQVDIRFVMHWSTPKPQLMRSRLSLFSANDRTEIYDPISEEFEAIGLDPLLRLRHDDKQVSWNIEKRFP